MIHYQLSMSSHVEISIYNILGKKIKTLLDTRKSAGYHVIDFDGSKLTSGIYFYQMKTNNYVKSKKMILLK